MQHFLCRLSPPRSSFPGDMSDAEARLMGEHATYWAGLLQKGNVVAFGPVLDPAGVWGLALVEAEDEAAARALTDHDPVIRAGIGFAYALYAMPQARVRPASGRTTDVQD